MRARKLLSPLPRHRYILSGIRLSRPRSASSRRSVCAPAPRLRNDQTRAFTTPPTNLSRSNISKRVGIAGAPKTRPTWRAQPAASRASRPRSLPPSFALPGLHPRARVRSPCMFARAWALINSWRRRVALARPRATRRRPPRRGLSTDPGGVGSCARRRHGGSSSSWRGWHVRRPRGS